MTENSTPVGSGLTPLMGINVPRHEFVFHEHTEQAYADGPLPIGEHQVNIQHSLAARVTQALHLQESEMNTHPG